MSFIYWIILPLAGLILGWFIRWVYARFQLSSSEQKAERLSQDAVKEAEAKKREVLLEAKDQLLKERNQLEREFRERRNELQRFERRILQKEENLEKKIAGVEKQRQGLTDREGKLAEKENLLQEQEEKWIQEMERIANISREEAKSIIIQSMEQEAKKDAQVIVNKIEQEAQATAEKKSRDILVTTIQRLSTEIAAEVSVTSVNLPSDEMKGRIIGREGTNIRTL